MERKDAVKELVGGWESNTLNVLMYCKRGWLEVFVSVYFICRL